MRICLICVGYEPGRDGVGDYVRGLIEHLPESVSASVIAINDPFVNDVVNNDAPVIRIPSRLSQRQRYALAADALRSFNPDTISLQFVTWAFGPKGVVFGEAMALRALTNGRCLHIMFHEPWVRTSRGAGLAEHIKRRLLGAAQRASIIRMTNILRPIAAHTSNQAYQTLFSQAGIATDILPIFGSVAPMPGDGWETVRSLARTGGKEDPGGRERYLVAGLFGAIRDRWDALPLLRRLAAFAASDERRFLLVSVGHNTPLGKELLCEWTAALPEMTVLTLGSQPVAAISQVIASFDLGLAHQSAMTLARSTTTAALLEHGRPVIPAGSDALDDADPFIRRWRPLLIVDGDALEDDLRRAGQTPPPSMDLRRETATQLADDLERACSRSRQETVL